MPTDSRKIKVSQASGPILDWLVAKLELGDAIIYVSRTPDSLSYHDPGDHYKYLSYSTDWAQGGPIIEREKIELTPPLPDYLRTVSDNDWLTTKVSDARNGITVMEQGSTALLAAMRCYVTSKLGEEVEVPREVCRPA